MKVTIQMRETYPALAQQAKVQGADIYIWDESGFRADTVHGKTWGVRGQTPVVLRPGQRQSFSAASAVNAKGAFWFCTYEGALNAELFIELLQKMMKYRRGPLHRYSTACRHTRRRSYASTWPRPTAC